MFWYMIHTITYLQTYLPTYVHQCRHPSIHPFVHILQATGRVGSRPTMETGPAKHHGASKQPASFDATGGKWKPWPIKIDDLWWFTYSNQVVLLLLILHWLYWLNSTQKKALERFRGPSKASRSISIEAWKNVSISNMIQLHGIVSNVYIISSKLILDDLRWFKMF